MKIENETAAVIVCAIFIGIMACVVAHTFGYNQGQKDAVIGIQHWKLTESGERASWERIQ